ncbi:MAG TPA: folate-binding protein YgfZ [Aestuariivirga sp.]|nr:folate-binding protein YgfZ [Alphaproteobacteria bacterium]HRX35226.1 folate-binding protein YgfZ [Aestuariivirga sp.]
MRDIHFTEGSLPGRAVLRIEGPEAAHFLHNLLTTDIEALEPGRAAYGALLTPQGKMLFDMFVARTEAGFLVDCAASQAADLAKRLSLYKLRAKVTVSAGDGLHVGVAGTEPAEALRYVDPRCPTIGWRYISEQQSPPAEDYNAARIALGLADTDDDLGSGDYFPHEANLDQLCGVSFKKGCYIGQEVVSRMEHRGTARNRILPVELDGTPPAKGTVIRSGDKQIGTLLSSRGTMALALIRLDRLAEAAEPLLTDAVTVTVLKPRWARYDVPNAGDEA